MTKVSVRRALFSLTRVLLVGLVTLALVVPVAGPTAPTGLIRAQAAPARPGPQEVPLSDQACRVVSNKQIITLHGGNNAGPMVRTLELDFGRFQVSDKNLRNLTVSFVGKAAKIRNSSANGSVIVIEIDPIALPTGLQQIVIVVPQIPNGTGCATVRAFNAAPDQRVPTVPAPGHQCTSLEVVDLYGNTVPALTNTSGTVRKPARDLSEEEIQAGSRAYINTSAPVELGLGRYESQLWYQRSGDGKFVGIGPRTGWVYNALSYNSDDNWLYAISQKRWGFGYLSKKGVIFDDPCFPMGHLLQIDPVTGEVIDLGLITGAGGVSSPFDVKDLQGGINVGVIGADGVLWASNSSKSGTRVLYRIDLANVTAVRTAYVSKSEDLAMVPSAPEYAWGIRSKAVTDVAGQVQLERINLNTGAVDRMNIAGLTTAAGKSVAQKTTWGKAWTYGNGDLGFGTGGAGANQTVVQIHVKDPRGALNAENISLVSILDSAPASFNTDGASRLAKPADKRPDLRVMKTVAVSGEEYLTWNMTITNDGPGDSSGFVLNDKLPQGFTIDSQDAVTVSKVVPIAGEAGVPKAVDYTITVGESGESTAVEVRVGSIPGGHEVTVQIRAKRPAAAIAECVANTVIIVPNENDPDDINNTSTASDCKLTFEKSAIDIPGTDEGIEEGDSSVMKTHKDGGDTRFRTVRYDLVVTNPADVELTYTLADTPKFTGDVTPAFVTVQEKKGAGADAERIGVQGSLRYAEAFVGGAIPVSRIVNGLRASNPSPTDDVITIGPRQKHYFELEYYYEMNAATLNEDGRWDHLQCLGEKGNGKAGEGLLNTAVVTDLKNRVEIADDDCVPIIQIKDPAVRLLKVDADDVTSSLDGASFEVFRVSDDGGSLGEEVAESGGKYTVPAGRYGIVEMQAPDGYSLLAAPIYFEVVPGDDGFRLFLLEKAAGGRLTRLNGPSAGLVDLVTDKGALVDTGEGDFAGAPADGGVFSIRIADVTTGDLPLTGGSGVLPVIAAGGLLAALAALASRRVALGVLSKEVVNT